MKYDPLKDGKSLVEYIQHAGTDLMVVNAARVSFSQDQPTFRTTVDEKDEKLIRYLANNKHSSPFQHCSVTLHVACPLFVYAQWRRHRTFDYTQINEVSRRYTSEDIEFYYPERWRGQSTDNKQASDGFLSDDDDTLANDLLVDCVFDCLTAYNRMLEMGAARELARMVLPQNMYTRFYCTMDLWNLYHYWSLRKDPHAQEEIRVYAEAVDKIASELYPVSWTALKGG